MNEETKYQEFFQKALEKFGVKSPEDFEDDVEKKKFFDYVDKNWKSEDEKEGIEEATEDYKVGDLVSCKGKTYKVFKVDGTTLHVGEKKGKNQYGGTKMIHTSKVSKINEEARDAESILLKISRML